MNYGSLILCEDVRLICSAQRSEEDREEVKETEEGGEEGNKRENRG